MWVQHRGGIQDRGRLRMTGVRGVDDHRPASLLLGPVSRPIIGAVIEPGHLPVRPLTLKLADQLQVAVVAQFGVPALPLGHRGLALQAGLHPIVRAAVGLGYRLIAHGEERQERES